MVTPILRSTRQRGVRGLTPVEEPKKTLAPVKEPLRVMNPEIEAYNIDNVSTAAPLALNPQPTPVIETRSLLDGNVSQNPSDPTKPNLARTAPTIQQTGQPIIETDPAAEIKAAGEAGNLTTELGKQRANLEGEITALQEKMANVPAGVAASKERLGINKDKELLRGLNEQLSGVKQDLLAAQDQQTEISELGRQKISDFGGTSRDFGQLTNAEQRKNQLDQLALSRTFSRLGDTASSIQASINDNVSIINEQAKAEQSKIEFDINQKNKILDRVIQTQGSILSGEQTARLEAVKQANALELQRQGVNLATKKMLLEKAAAKGYDIAQFGDIASVDINDIITKTSSPSRPTDYLTATPSQMAAFTPSDWKVYDALKDANTEDEKVQAQKDLINNTNANNASGLVDIISDMLSTDNAEGLANSVGVTAVGRADFDLFGYGSESTQFRALAEQLVSDSTLKKLVDLKQSGGTLGALSDGERVMLEKAATGKLGNYLGDGQFDAKEEDFRENLEQLNMANMKVYLASKNNDAWKNSGLQAIDYNTAVGTRDDGSVVTGYDFVKSMFDGAKFNVLNQKPVDIYTIEGELVGSGKPEIALDKIVAIESGGSYSAVNPTSGAYGKYQFMPATLNQYASRLGMSEQQAKTPEGQEAMFAEFTKDNIAGLEKANIPINTVTVYLAHQQGLGGAKQINSGNISPQVRNNLLANLPPQYNGQSDEAIIQGWLNTFSPRLT